MSLIVQKYGGTSLGTAERLKNVAKIIQSSIENYDVIAVVSAMSSYTKSEGTTSRLIMAGEQAIQGEEFFKIIDLVEESHFEALDEAIASPIIREEIKELVHHELRTLKSFLEAIHVIKEISPRSQDMIIGTGERLSASLLSGVLKDIGVDSEYINLSEIVPEGVDLTDHEFYPKIQKEIVKKLPQNKKVVPVVTGYFGFVPGGMIPKIGRGYTDLTAALIASELKAQELQIWKEVDGIYSADPRKVPKAKVLDEISPAEAAELTYFGSEVLHPFTMEQAIKAKVPIRIKNTFDPNIPGTVILTSRPEPKYSTQNKIKHSAVAVTTKRDATVLNINSNRMLHSSGFLQKVFETFQKYRIVVDLIATSEVNISCSIDKSNNLDQVKKELEELGSVTSYPNRAIVSIVGEGMKYGIGVAGHMFSTLARNNINLEMITQGASEINISCVIKQEDAEKALMVIHEAFLE